MAQEDTIDGGDAETFEFDLDEVLEQSLPEKPPAQTQTDEEDEDLRPGSRAEKRIRRLISEKKALESQLARAREEATATGEVVKTQNQQTLEIVESKLATDAESLTAAMRKAFEDGDVDKFVEAQTKLSETQAQLVQVKTLKQPVRETPKESVRPPAPPPPPEEPSETFREWKRDNSWFNKDRVMTAAAFAIHQELIDEGFRPDTQDPDFGEGAYFKELTKRVQNEFPTKFQAAPQRRSPVLAPSGVSSMAKRKVTLTRDELEFCNRNSIDPKSFAIEKAKIEAKRAR